MPNITHKLNDWTNCIVDCEWADGEKRTPAMLYTYNPEFDLDAVSKAQKTPEKGRILQVKKAQDTLKRHKARLVYYKIAQSRVVYVEPKKTTSKYCAESAEIVEHFIKT